MADRGTGPAWESGVEAVASKLVYHDHHQETRRSVWRLSGHHGKRSGELRGERESARDPPGHGPGV